MKKLTSLYIYLIIGIVIASCSPTPVASVKPPPTVAAATLTPLTNDFTPPVGREPNAVKESPGEFRLLSATSPDGLTFTRTNQIISDQANVPDMIVDDKGRIFLYYTMSKVGNVKDACAVAISSDNGKTWVYKLAKFNGIQRQALSDPDVVRLPDGTIRFYGTTQEVGKKIGIVVGESKDGITFDVKGTAFEMPSENALDSITFQFGDQWHIMTLANDGIENMLYGTSSDGLKFTYKERVNFRANNRPYAPSNGFVVSNGYRMYAFTIPDISSFISTDGKTWKIEEGVRLAFDPSNPLESQFVKDAAVVKLANGTYFMVYTTKLAK